MTRYDAPTPGTHPALLYPAYRSTTARAPIESLVPIPHTFTETGSPSWSVPTDNDLTAQHAATPIGQRIIIVGQVIDTAGVPIEGTLVEIWQANAAGRYAHRADNSAAPLDPNFTGSGRMVTGVDGGYRFVTIKPGAYGWGNHANAWRPAHVHFSVLGPALATRLVTQMYFPGDPLLECDPIFQSVEPAARERLIADLDLDDPDASNALVYRFDVVLRRRLED